MFDDLPPGVSPEDCEPEPWVPPEGPDRHYEKEMGI